MLTKRVINLGRAVEKRCSTEYLSLGIGFNMLSFSSCKSTVSDKATSLNDDYFIQPLIIMESKEKFE